MIEHTSFLGLSESVWQGIFGFLSTVIVAVTVGFITVRWLSKQEALNEREGEILNNRITAYLEILDSMARINERIVVFDADLKIRNELGGYGIITLRDRPAVEYPPFLESREKLQAILLSLDNFYVHKLHLIGPKAYKGFIFIYLYLSKLDGYYKYLMTTPMPDGSYLDASTADRVLKEFLPKIGIALDFDMLKMQVDFERALVGELYRLKSCKKPPFKNEEKQTEFFHRKFYKTLYSVNEVAFFRMLTDMTAKETNIPHDLLHKYFKANEHVVTPFLGEVR